MLIESLAQKTRLAMMTVFAVIGGCTVICAFTVWCCISLVNEERQQIYVLDGDIPFLAERARLEANFTMEAKAHIQLFHQYFFNLPLDNDYIKWTVGKAMYMADGTALKQKQAWTRTVSTRTSFPLRLSAPSCATPFSLTNMNGSLPITVRNLSSAGPETSDARW